MTDGIVSRFNQHPAADGGSRILQSRALCSLHARDVKLWTQQTDVPSQALRSPREWKYSRAGLTAYFLGWSEKSSLSR